MSDITSDAESPPCGFRVAPLPAAVPDARRRIVAVVRGWDVPLSDDAYDELELLSTELITNAIRYTEAACAVVVRWTGARVRVEVTDVDPVRPQRRDASLEAENGRGLLLVETLAAAWGSAPDPAGKVVWFEVGPPDPLPPSRKRRLVIQVCVALPFASPALRPSGRRQPGRFSRGAGAEAGRH